MRRYAHNSFVLIFLFGFVHIVFSLLSPNQISTMNKLYGMIQNDTGSSFPWRMVNKSSDPCSWEGVSCRFPLNASSASVVELDLYSFSISGPDILPVLCQIDTLEYLFLSYNNLSLIPDGFITGCGGIKGLRVLSFRGNELAGALPTFRGFPMLVYLDLSNNSLSGTIISQLHELDSLKYLNLSYNNLNGSIPDDVPSQPNLLHVDLSSNSLEGKIPCELGYYTSLELLNLGQNRLTGILPPALGNLVNLRVLKLGQNNLVRTIPDQFSDLQKLEVLDISNNMISGVIPSWLTRLKRLNQLLLQNNQLSGGIPQFYPSVMVVLSGNKDLTNKTAMEDPDPEQLEEPHIDYALIACFFSGFVFGLSLVKFIPYMPRYSKAIKWHWITNNNIHKSSLNFSKAMKAIKRPTNIFLKNEFSTCYKAAMPCGTNYRIRKLYWSSKSFSLLSPKEFACKIEVLGHLNNSNIMSPLAYAFAIQSTLVAYEWPEQGTLFDLLHGNNENILTWENRYEIAVGVAKGIAFLHGSHLFGRSTLVLLHLSTRSIFMKSISEPLIGDFELSMLINPSKSLGTLSVVVGNVGYVPPEYAYIMRVSMAGNIYSFGVVLLELLTGKKAINEGVELAKWVLNKSIEDEIDEIFYQRVICSAEVYQQMLSMLRIALCCIDASAEERPEAKELLAMLLDVAP